MFRAIARMFKRPKPSHILWMCGTCGAFMQRTEAERLAMDYPESVTTVEARCDECNTAREFFSDLTPQYAEYCIDLTLESMNAGLRAAGYPTEPTRLEKMTFESNALFDEEAITLVAHLPAKPALVVIGSTSYHHHESASTCSMIGGLLATVPNLLVITGGMTGIGEGVGRSVSDIRKQNGDEPDVFHILPRGCAGWDYGTTLFAGSNMAERREILARLSQLYLAIEGGPGTVHEGQVALRRGASVITVGRSGGYAGEVYPTLGRPAFVSEAAWNALGDSTATPQRVARAVYDIVLSQLRNCLTKPNETAASPSDLCKR